MAFGITFEIPGMTPEQYDQVAQRLNTQAKGQPGFILHLSGPTETGYRITEVWESEEAQGRFAQEHVVPLFAHYDIPPGTAQTFPVHNVVTK